MEKYIYYGGQFVNIGNANWQEWQQKQLRFHFKETERDHKWITLYDASRNIWVALPVGDGKSYYNRGDSDWTELYEVRRAKVAPSSNKDGFWYTVKSGDWLDGIAKRNGLLSWKDIYYHEKNKAHREKRKDPNKLYPGDKLWIQTDRWKTAPPKTVDPKTRAEQDKSTSLTWIAAAMGAIKSYELSLMSGLGDPLGFHQLTKTALDVHFHLNKGPYGELVYLSTIKKNYSDVVHTLNNSANVFRTRSTAEAVADKGVDKNNIPYPAYTFYQTSINFTHSFLGFGPLCRAAMVLHEPVHFVDKLATGANDFYEHGKQYDTLTPEQAIHNPSSYVSFAEHIYYRKDERFGAGRPNE